MRYRVEFLAAPNADEPIVHTLAPFDGDLKLAEFQAEAFSGRARVAYGACGYQIRDLKKKGKVVLLQRFYGPPAAVH